MVTILSWVWEFPHENDITKTKTTLLIMRSICCVCCGDLHKLHLWKLQRWWSLVTLGCTRAPKGNDIWLAMKETTIPKVLTLLIIDRFLPLKFHITITFSSKNYCSICIVIANAFLDLAECTMPLILWQGVATDHVRPKTKLPLKWPGKMR